MKRKQILILLMGAMMALSACQATPEEDVIVQKAEQQEKLTQAADVAPELVGKSLREQMNIPETISFQVTDSSGKHIYTADNAPVNVPDTDKASTANAIRDDFTDEDTKTWTEAFFGDAKVWKTEEYVATKSDYMDWINQENENWEQEKENLASDENNRAYIENYEKEHQDRINEMTAQMETAPETAPEPKYEAPEYKLVQSEDYQTVTENGYYNGFDITGKVGDMEASLSIYNSDWGTGGYYFLQTSETGYPITDDFWKTRTEEIPNNCKYSEEEAVQMVKDLLEKLQPGNNLTVKEINPTYNGSKMDELGNSLDSQIESYIGYQMLFVREVNGMQENTTMYSGTDDEEIEATYIPFGYERVEVNVGDEGITSFSWMNRMQEGEILQENVEMISFEKVQSIIEEQIMMKHADTKDIEVRQKVVSVDLGLMCVRKPNDNSSFTMVPVWDVYEIWEEAIIESDLWADTELTINAIDGSIINRGYRY